MYLRAMRVDEIPTSDLERLVVINERAAEPDPYAISVLRREIDRRESLDDGEGPA